MGQLAVHSLNSIMILVPSLFSRSPLGVLTIGHVAKSAGKDYEDEEQEYKRLHDALLCCMSDTLFA